MTDWIDVSDVTPRVAYVATAGQTAFTVPFVFYDESDLVVTVNGVVKTLSTDYATSGAEDEAGGTVTLVVASSLSDSVIIELALPKELTTHIPPSGPLDIPAINRQFSKLVSMIQQLGVNLPRSLRQPSSDVDDFTALPVAASRANLYLAFDDDGQPSLVASVESAVAATAFMLTLLDDTSAAAARTTLGITDQSAYAGLSNWHLCR